MTTYHGRRDADGCQVRVTTDRFGHLLLARLDLAALTAQGFDWGIASPGSAQLALALCCHALESDKEAMAVFQQVKARLVACWESDVWELTEDRLMEIIQQIQEEEAERLAKEQGALTRGNHGRTGRKPPRGDFNSSGFRSKKPKQGDSNAK